MKKFWFFRRLLISFCNLWSRLYFYQNLGLNSYHSRPQLLWGSVIAIITAVATPVAKKDERGIIVWALGSCFTVILAIYGFCLSFIEFDALGDTVGIYAWRSTLVLVTVYIPIIHMAGKQWDINDKSPFLTYVHTDMRNLLPVYFP